MGTEVMHIPGKADLFHLTVSIIRPRKEARNTIRIGRS